MEKQNNDKLILMAVGDVMLGEKVGDVMLENGWEHPFKHVAPVFQEADIVFGNLPTPLSDYSIPNPAKPEGYPLLKADPRAIESLKYAGFNILSLANNHIMDFGERALFDTMDVLNKAGIETLGVGKNEIEASTARLFKKNNIKVAFLGYSCSYAASKDTPGCAPIRLPVIKRDINIARENADIVVVSMHHGIEYSDYPVPAHITLAHRIIDSGADLILGHHPHVLQGIEQYNGGVIIYSLGNFVHDIMGREMKKRTFDECALSKIGGVNLDPDDERPCESIILKCILGREGVLDFELIPVYINSNYQTVLLNGERKDQLLERFGQISTNLNDMNMPIWQILTDVNARENVTSLFKRDPLYILKKFHRIRAKHLSLFLNYILGNLKKQKNT